MTTLDLSVGAAYIVQNVQNRDGTVPLVAGRPGVLRVFVVANAANTVSPSVSVLVYSGATLRETLTVPANPPPAAVPTAVNQASLDASWNFDLSAQTIQPGLRFLVRVDPQNAVNEDDDNNNTFPANGTPKDVSVAAMPTLRLRFVPIHQTDNGRTGEVNAGNLEEYLGLARKIMPVLTIDADIRAAYSVSFLEPNPQQGNTWVAAVSELDAVRVAEGTGRYYYGVVKNPPGGAGILGIAAGIPSRTSLGADRTTDEDETFAHELGHNWGRRHSPCGGAGGADPSYPYTQGLIGVYGLDVATRALKTPQEFTDIMGYCDAAFWISDYTYTGVYNYRLANDQQVVATPQPALLVWGRIDDGKLVLEPAFEVVTRPVLPDGTGPYVIEGVDDAGVSLFSYAFAGERVPDVNGDQRLFTFAIPLDPTALSRLTELRLRGRGREVVHTTHAREVDDRLAAASRAPLTRRAGGSAVVEWDTRTHTGVMVRDAHTGTILSIARGGRASVANTGSDLELLMSDGVRTTRTRIRP